MFRLVFLFLSPLSVAAGLLDWFQLASYSDKQVFRKRWIGTDLNYLTVSTLTFVSACDFAWGEDYLGTMIGGQPGLASQQGQLPNKHCGHACTLLAGAFGDAGYPRTISGYSSSDHVHFVCLVPSNQYIRGVHASVQLTNDGADSDRNANVMITFRGTYAWDIVNNRRNTQFTLHQTGLCGRCAVHRGFWRNFVSLKFAIKKVAVQATSLTHGAPYALPEAEWKVALFGHSMGASLAALTSTYFKFTLKSKNVGLYLLGSPRIGNSAFAAHVTASAHILGFLANARDPVPHSGRSHGYRHPGNNLYELFMDPVYHVLLQEGDVDTDFRQFMYYRTHKSDLHFAENAHVLQNSDHLTYFIGLDDMDLMTCGGMADYFIANSKAMNLFG